MVTVATFALLMWREAGMLVAMLVYGINDSGNRVIPNLRVHGFRESCQIYLN